MLLSDITGLGILCIILGRIGLLPSLNDSRTKFQTETLPIFIGIMKMVYLILIFTFLLFSCETKKRKFRNGWHKAYVELANSYTDKRTDSAGRVLIEEGAIKKICFESKRCVEGFANSEEYRNGLMVYVDSFVYIVYIIPEPFPEELSQ